MTKFENLQRFFYIVFILAFVFSCSESEAAKKKQKIIIPKTKNTIETKSLKKQIPVNSLKKLRIPTRYDIFSINNKRIPKNKRIIIEDEILRIDGWAYDAITNKPADRVYLLIGNQKFLIKDYGIEKLGLGKKLGLTNNRIGFLAEIPKKSIKSKDYKLNLLVVSNDGQSTFKPTPSKTIEIIFK